MLSIFSKTNFDEKIKIQKTSKTLPRKPTRRWPGCQLIIRVFVLKGFVRGRIGAEVLGAPFVTCNSCCVVFCLF